MTRSDQPVHADGQSPAEVADAYLRRLSRSTSMPLRPHDHELLVGTEPFRFGPDDSRVAWSVGSGPLVLLVHGWGGRGVQMGSLAQALAAVGYRCVFFDAGGHGDSRPEPVGFDTFIRDTGALTTAVDEPVSAWIGHSAGALGMMAGRALTGVAADRYVCIAAPQHPYIPLDSLRAAGADDEVIERAKAFLAAQFEISWPAVVDGAAWHPEEGVGLLVAQDADDERVRSTDPERIAAGWPGARVLRTAGHGHNRILRAPEVRAAVLEFLGRPT